MNMKITPLTDTFPYQDGEWDIQPIEIPDEKEPLVHSSSRSDQSEEMFPAGRSTWVH